MIRLYRRARRRRAGVRGLPSSVILAAVGDDRGMSEQVDQQPAPPSQASTYARGSVLNMVRSLLVIGAMMAGLFFIVARTNSMSGPVVDIPKVGNQVVAQLHWPIQVPVGLPDGWRPSAVRFVPSTDNLSTWHVGYTSPAGHYVAVEQTKDATKAWITQQTNRAPVTGTVSAGGREWQKYVRDIKTQNSLVAPGPGELTTIITGDGTFDELALFADHLKPFTPTAS